MNKTINSCAFCEIVMMSRPLTDVDIEKYQAHLKIHHGVSFPKEEELV